MSHPEGSTGRLAPRATCPPRLQPSGPAWCRGPEAAAECEVPVGTEVQPIHCRARQRFGSVPGNVGAPAAAAGARIRPSQAKTKTAACSTVACTAARLEEREAARTPLCSPRPAAGSPHLPSSLPPWQDGSRRHLAAGPGPPPHPGTYPLPRQCHVAV